MLLDVPFVSFTKFNDSIVMGSLAFSLALFIPVFFLMRILVLLWRKMIAPIIIKSKVWQFLTGLPVVKKAIDIAGELKQ